MSDFIIIVRHPNGTIVPITNDDESIAEYPSVEEAELALSDLPFCAAHASEAIEINI